MKLLLIFLNWIGKSFAGPNGQPSSMRLLAFSVFFSCYAFGRIMFIIHIEEAKFQLYGCALDCAFILLLYGILKPADIVSLKNGLLDKGSETVKTITETKEEKIKNIEHGADKSGADNIPPSA